MKEWSGGFCCIEPHLGWQRLIICDGGKMENRRPAGKCFLNLDNCLRSAAQRWTARLSPSAFSRPTMPVLLIAHLNTSR
ncbi:hypothetical protein QWZ10_19035 [Paracoccus cavernae]|uniref:Transposase DDE domain-containing protein n=1 Tax=Paracoccus cavernae TaxID=1571207 RepID=A0ABT8DCY6_9RHOB|nr:hypothetical protein [Paracoccus cavernae]